MIYLSLQETCPRYKTANMSANTCSMFEILKQTKYLALAWRTEGRECMLSVTLQKKLVIVSEPANREWPSYLAVT